MLLLLFDVDGTLLGGAAEAHRDAVRAALLAVYGVDAGTVRRAVPSAGRTDGEIARELLLEAGVSAERIDDRADAFREEVSRTYARMAPPDLSHTVLPGIRELLSWLSGRTGARRALLTGNYEPIAWLKLARAGIAGAFERGQGAFGSDCEDRAALPAIARRRAGSPGRPYPRAATIIIGDTPRDIACAQADGLRCAAVATGQFTAAELAGADAVVGDAFELRGALEALGV